MLEFIAYDDKLPALVAELSHLVYDVCNEKCNSVCEADVINGDQQRGDGSASLWLSLDVEPFWSVGGLRVQKDV